MNRYTERAEAMIEALRLAERKIREAADLYFDPEIRRPALRAADRLERTIALLLRRDAATATAADIRRPAIVVLPEAAQPPERPVPAKKVKSGVLFRSDPSRARHPSSEPGSPPRGDRESIVAQ
jgi:hypothetical protein